MPNTPKKTEEWEKEFDRGFVNSKDCLTRTGKRVKNRNLRRGLKEFDMKSFISSLLSQKDQEIKEELVEKVVDMKFKRNGITKDSTAPSLFTDSSCQKYVDLDSWDAALEAVIQLLKK